MDFFLCVVGMVLVIEGIPYFGFPEKMKAFLRVIEEQNELTLRIMGGVMMAVGLLLVFLARKALGQR